MIFYIKTWICVHEMYRVRDCMYSFEDCYMRLARRDRAGYISQLLATVDNELKTNCARYVNSRANHRSLIVNYVKLFTIRSLHEGKFIGG